MQGLLGARASLRTVPALSRTSACSFTTVLGRQSFRSQAAALQSRFLGTLPQSLSYHTRTKPAWQQAYRRVHYRCKQVQAAIFGVGAPEALLVGVVALIVFGPKGLAEAVKSLGATFRTISPTIKEVISATTDLRSSLEEQIGLDEIRNEFRSPSSTPRPSTSYDADSSADSSSNSGRINGVAKPVSNGAGSTTSEAANASQHTDERQYFGDDFDVDIEAKRRDAAKLAWGTATGSDEPVENSSGTSSSAGLGGALAGMSLEELEAELARRKAARNTSSERSA